MRDASSVALKEWAVIVRALREGRQCLLLRKGGIADEGGVFTLKEKEFFFYPTYEHQQDYMIQACFAAEFAGSVRDRSPDGRVRIDTYATVEKVKPIATEAELRPLLKHSIWSVDYLDQRWSYKPEKPLYLVAVRAYRMKVPQKVIETPAYAGCVSWVPLEAPLPIGALEPAMRDSDFARETASLFGK